MVADDHPGEDQRRDGRGEQQPVQDREAPPSAETEPRTPSICALRLSGLVAYQGRKSAESEQQAAEHGEELPAS